MSKGSSVAIIGGSNDEAADFILNSVNEDYYSKRYKEGIDSESFRTNDRSMNPEKSDFGTERTSGQEDGWGYLIATSTSIDLAIWKFKSQSEAVAFCIIHGMGHNAGYYHSPSNASIERGFMNSGNSIISRLPKEGANSIVSNTPVDVINKIQNRYK